MTSKQIERRFNVLKTAVAILLSLGFALLVITFVSNEPVKAITAFIVGPFQKASRMSNIVEVMTPLLFTGTAICIMYQANQFSMIGEGAFLIGANLCTWVSITLQSMAGLPLLLICFVVAIMAGVASAMVPAILKVKFRANEVVSSIMMNYVLLKLSDYFFYYHFRDVPSGQQASYPIPTQIKLPKLIPGLRLHAGVLIGLAVCVVAYLFIYKTKWGYQVRMTGANINFAKYSGISVLGVALSTQLIGGAIAGLGGAVEILGRYDRFIWFGTQPGFGFDGVLVGVLAKNNPLLVPVAALFLAYMRTGADVMNRVSDVPIEFVDVVQGLIILFVAAEMFMAKYKHKLIVNNAKKQLEAKEAAN
ncbi:MAG: ABC transporter permease [Oscillospiraceae bacterium]|nr:ABC transporter permease [Oscillospiraceae bacterium]